MKHSFLLVVVWLTTFSLQAKEPYKRFIKLKLEDKMQLIPGGSYEVYQRANDNGKPYFVDSTRWNHHDGASHITSTHIHVDSFYISAYEVTNRDYLEFLYDLQQKSPEKLMAALPDTLIWTRSLSFGEAYMEYYFRHPAYQNYPMVGVTHKQANLFCEWLTEIYNNRTNRKYKKVIFRLPTQNEWEYAATNQRQLTKKELQKKGIFNGAAAEKSPYYFELTWPFPWYLRALQNDDGQWLANFTPVDQTSIQTYKNATLVSGADTANGKMYVQVYTDYFKTSNNLMELYDFGNLTVPVYAFQPGFNGLYNMAGNVEEMVAEYGITKGGSWGDTGYYLHNLVSETYDSTNETSSMRGFRIAMNVLEEF